MISHFPSSSLSLSELNARLEICRGPQVLAALTGLEQPNEEKLSLEQFLEKIAVPLQSCSDLTSENLDTFVAKVGHVFSVQTEPDLILLALFRTKMEEQRQKGPLANAQVSVLPPAAVVQASASKAASSTSQACPDDIIQAAKRINPALAHFNPKKFDPSDMSSHDEDILPMQFYLEQVPLFFSLSSEERMEAALRTADASSAEKKAHMLQLFLSHLIQEQLIFKEIYELLSFTQDYYKLLFQNAEHMHAWQSGNSPPTGASASNLFEIPTGLDEPELLAFYLKVFPICQATEIDGKMYYSVKSYAGSTRRHGRGVVFPADLRNWMAQSTNIDAAYTKLVKQTSDESKLSAINAVYKKGKMHLVELNIIKKASESTVFVLSCEQYLVKAEKAPIDALAIVTPLGLVALGVFWRQIKQCLVTESGMMQPRPDILVQIDAMCQLFEVFRGQQEELYQVAYQRLQKIIQGSKNKRMLVKFTKNLAVSPAAILTSLPESIRKEKKEEIRIHTPKPKVPAAAPKKKTESVKKPAKHQKGVSKEEALSDPVLENTNPATSSSTSDQPSLPEIETPATISGDESLVADAPAPDEVPMVNLSSVIKLPGSAFPYSYDKRVERWHEHTFGLPLPVADFPEYCDASFDHQVLMHLFHALHPLVDRFLSQGIKGTWINSQRQKEDIRIVIVSEITYQGKKRRGFIVYTIDRRTQVCYHKFFSEKINRDLMCQMINRTFDENDFPELQKAALVDRRKAPAPVRTFRGTVKIDPIFDFIEIEDKVQDLHIRLFKAYDEAS